MNDETTENTSNRGGKRENAGRNQVDNEKREYSYKLTQTEKELIDGYRNCKK